MDFSNPPNSCVGLSNPPNLYFMGSSVFEVGKNSSEATPSPNPLAHTSASKENSLVSCDHFVSQGATLSRQVETLTKVNSRIFDGFSFNELEMAPATTDMVDSHTSMGIFLANLLRSL